MWRQADVPESEAPPWRRQESREPSHSIPAHAIAVVRSRVLRLFCIVFHLFGAALVLRLTRVSELRIRSVPGEDVGALFVVEHAAQPVAVSGRREPRCD